MSGRYAPYKKGKYRWKSLTGLAVALILLALAMALWINAGRLAMESQDKTIGLLVDYDELKRVADAGAEITFADMLRKAQKAGATGLVVRERILSDWETGGDVVVLQGGELALYADMLTQGGVAIDDLPEIQAGTGQTYILTKDQAIQQQLAFLLEAKKRYPATFAFGEYFGIASQLHSSERATLGLGWPMDQLAEAAAMGYEIIPRLRNWEPVRSDNLAGVFDLVAAIPGLAGIGFNDATTPGGDTPQILDLLAQEIAPLDVPLISFEFYDQAGLSALAGRLDNRVIRAHAIAENELRKYADFDDAVDRFTLAATERNIRYIYLRFYGLENPVVAVDNNMDLIARVKAGLAAEGFAFGRPGGLADVAVSFHLRFLLGLGVIAAGGWLVALLAQPLVSKRFYLPYVMLLAVVVLCWGIMLLQMPVLATKLCALAAAVVFPSLSALLALIANRNEAQPTQLMPALGKGIAQFLFMWTGTLVGAMILAALLGDTPYMLKLDSFVGVKLAHLAPLLLVPCGLWLRENHWQSLLADTAKNSVKFWQLAVGLVILAALGIYILRTGNDSLGAVSSLEMRFRQLLDQVLGVRPRSKEFLIGHPLMLILLYFGYRFAMYPVLLLGLIGQISLINTYAHLHTPLAVSFLRSVHGLWVGILIGSMGIVLIRFCLAKLTPIWAGRREGPRHVGGGGG